MHSNSNHCSYCLLLNWFAFVWDAMALFHIFVLQFCLVIGPATLFQLSHINLWLLFSRAFVRHHDCARPHRINMDLVKMSDPFSMYELLLLLSFLYFARIMPMIHFTPLLRWVDLIIYISVSAFFPSFGYFVELGFWLRPKSWIAQATTQSERVSMVENRILSKSLWIDVKTMRNCCIRKYGA